MTDDSDALRVLEEAALDALARGEHDSAAELAIELLRRDNGNQVARRILAQSDVENPGEMRRLTILFCDLVGSTSMSGRHEPDEYRRLLRLYHRMCGDVIAAHGGTVNNRVGDGVLALFGHPRSHEDDSRRAVRAGLALASEVAAMRPGVERDFGESLEVRIAIHLGPVHLDLLDSEIYGLAPNVAARLQDLAAPGTVVVSDEVLEVVGGFFETSSHEAQPIKGVDAPVGFHTIVRELPQTPERGRSWHMPFVGRSEALDRLGAAVRAGSSAVVRGESGIGKSRLVGEVLRDLDLAEHRLMAILCTEYEQSSDLGVASAVLRLDPINAAGTPPAERLQQLRDDLVELGIEPDEHLPLLAPLLGLEPSLGYTGPDTALSRVHHDQVLSSLRTWLGALGTREPLILLVEDVHWADASTCELLIGLVRDPVAGVQLVATERTGAERLTGPELVVVDVEPLSVDESTRLACAADESLYGARLAAVLSRGQGNPLFIEELAREPEATEPIDRESLHRLMSESVVPGALYEPLLARLYTSGVDIGLAEAAATIGRSFSKDVLGDVVPRHPDMLEGGLRSLLDAGLLDAEDEGVYWFRHALIRDVAYDLQPPGQRSAMHGRVGDALRTRREQGADIAWSVIANHHHSAGRIEDAIHGYTAAADDSRQRGSMAVGVEQLSTAIDLIGELAPDRTSRLQEVDLRLKRGFLCVSTAGNADARAVADYDRCLELVRAEEAGSELVSTLVALWGYHTARGDLAKADGLLDDIVATGITDDPVMLAENRTARGMVRFFQGDFASSEEHLRLAVEGVPDEVQDARPPSPWQFPNDAVAVMHVLLGLALWQRGDLAGFRDHLRRARHRTERLPRPHGPFNLAFALTYEAWVLAEVGDFAEGAASTAELLEISANFGFDFWTLAGTTADAVSQARASLASGTTDTELLLDQAGRLAGTAMMNQMIDSQLLLPYGLTAQGEFLAEAGDHDQALGLFDQAMAVADATGSQFYEAETHRLRARTRAALGHALAVEDLHLAIEIAVRQGSIPFELRARLDLAELGHRSERLEQLLADRDFVAAAGVGSSDLSSPTT